MANLTTDQINAINQRFPGFANMTPEQQNQVIQRMQTQASASGAQQPGNPIASTALPVATQVGINSAMSGGTAAGAAGADSLASGAGIMETNAGFNAGADAATMNAAPAAAGSSFLGALGIPAGIYTGVKQYQGLKNITKGRDASPIQHAALYPVTGGLDTITEKTGLNKVLGLGGKKSGDQQGRDDGRSVLQQLGIADSKYNVSLNDGTLFNVGLDGHTQYQNLGTNIDGKTFRNAWDVDFSNPIAKDLIPKVSPYVNQILGEDADQKSKDQLTGQIINAATSNAKSAQEAEANIKHIFKPFDDANKPPATTATAPAVGPSRGITVNVQQVKYPAANPQAVSQVPAIRNNILNKMLDDSMQPIQYPSQKRSSNSNPTATNLTSTLSKILG